MEIEREFGRIVINGKEYKEDVVIYKDKVFMRPKELSADKKVEGHTVLSVAEIDKILEEIGEKPQVVIIGTGAEGKLPIEDEVIEKLKGMAIRVITQVTPEAIETFKELKSMGVEPLFIVHITC